MPTAITSSPGHKCGSAPAQALERVRDCRLAEPAGRESHRGNRDRKRASAVEPVHDRDRDAHTPAEARAERHHQKGDVERQQRVNPAQHQKAEPEDDYPGRHHLPRPETVDKPTLDRAEQPAFDHLDRERGRKRSPAPPELALEHHDVGAEGVKHEPAEQRRDGEAAADDPPAVEDRRAVTHAPRRRADSLHRRRFSPGHRHRVTTCPPLTEGHLRAAVPLLVGDQPTDSVKSSASSSSSSRSRSRAETLRYGAPSDSSSAIGLSISAASPASSTPSSITESASGGSG